MSKSTSLSITGNSGLHLKFENGITLSVQIGRGNYCENRNLGDFSKDPVLACHDAEIAVFNSDGGMFNLVNDCVLGWVSIQDALLFATILDSLPSGITQNDFSSNELVNAWLAGRS